MVAFATEKNIEINPTGLKSLIWEKVKEWIESNVKITVMAMAEARGHEVLYSPPHHSDLQPIELVWAVVKGAVGMQYTTETTFAQVRERLTEQFKQLSPTTVEGCINKANAQLHDLLEHIKSSEEQEDLKCAMENNFADEVASSDSEFCDSCDFSDAST